MAAVFVIYVPTLDYEKKLDERKKGDSVSKSLPNSTGNSVSSNPDSHNANHSSLPRSKSDDSEILDQLSNTTDGILRRGSPPLRDGSPQNLVNEEVAEKCMEKELQIGLAKLKVDGAVWQTTKDGKFRQVVFPVESQERCEEIHDQLYINGIGRFKESTVSVLPCSVYSQSEDEQFGAFDSNTIDTIKEQKKSDFVKSIKARLTVAQVVDGVRGGATLTFDFVAFLCLAGLIAGFGLMDNSVVSIVASMLVSPLMGPIMALCFGAVIRDKSLWKLGIKSELFGLLSCITIGFILGLINAPWQSKWGTGYWPNSEMFARGQTHALWVGCLVALPSGAGVAMSILGANMSSLVGVAISASLLPPCVNCGILWANAVVLSLQALGEVWITHTYMYHGMLVNITNAPSLLPPGNYEWVYSSNMAYESAALGIISMCLTLVNIGSIVIMAVLVLKIKEVAPSSSMPATHRFWREDIRIARDYNRSVRSGNGSHLEEDIVEEWKKIDDTNEMSELADMVQEAEEDEVYQTIMRVTSNQFTLPPKTHHNDRGSQHLTWVAGDTNEGKTAVWDAFPGSRKFRGSNRRQTLVEARNRRCSFATSYRRGNFASSRFHVTKTEDSSTHPQLQRKTTLCRVPEDTTVV